MYPISKSTAPIGIDATPGNRSDQIQRLPLGYPRVVGACHPSVLRHAVQRPRTCRSGPYQAVALLSVLSVSVMIPIDTNAPGSSP